MIKVVMKNIGESFKNNGNEIIFTGDLCPKENFEEVFTKGSASLIYGDFIDILKNKCLSITNIECPITDSNIGIDKHGKRNKAIPSVINGIQKGFFDVASLANNHILDYGVQGLDDTVKTLKENNITPVGYKTTCKEKQNIFYKEIDGYTIALLTYAEEEFNTAGYNHAGANKLDLIDIHHELKIARDNADYIIIYFHGGNEHYNLPNPRLKKICHYMVDNGADIVVGTHPHCPGGYEIYKNKAIFYSLGNFIFPRQKHHKYPFWHLGYILRIRIDNKKRNLNCVVIPYKQLYYTKVIDKPILNPLADDEFRNFRKWIEKINTIIRDDDELIKNWRNYCKRMKSSTLSSLYFPFWWFMPLARRINIPEVLFPLKKLLVQDNFLKCQSNRERLKEILYQIRNEGTR